MTEFNKDIIDELRTKAVLSRVVETYFIVRADGQFDIRVYNVLSGEVKDNFVAVPRAAWIDADEEFHGEGTSSDEALRDCLLKIKDAAFDQIFPSQELSSERS